jgi:hypothetical protein
MAPESPARHHRIPNSPETRSWRRIETGGETYKIPYAGGGAAAGGALAFTGFHFAVPLIAAAALLLSGLLLPRTSRLRRGGAGER